MSALLTAQDWLCRHSCQWRSKYVHFLSFPLTPRTHLQEQVLSGVLPISRVSAVPFCIHQLSRLLPLEQILQLTHPSLATSPVVATSTSDVMVASTSDRDPTPQSGKSPSKAKSGRKPVPTSSTLVEDKRTWRPGQRPLGQTQVQSSGPKWTANDIMTAYAEKKGWVTAKAGRPDIHRAGNASECCQMDENSVENSMCTCVVLRLVAEGKVPWAFWPPDSSVLGDDGIWLKDGVQQHAWDEPEDDEDRDEDKESGDEESEMEELSSDEDIRVGVRVSSGESDDGGEEEREEGKALLRGGNLGRFGVLSIDD